MALNEDVGSDLNTANAQQNEVDDIFSKAESILRRYIFKFETSFNGSYHKHCQEQSVPALLQQFVYQLLFFETTGEVCSLDL